MSYKEYIKFDKPVRTSPVTGKTPTCKVGGCTAEAEGIVKYEVKHPQHGSGIECIRTSYRCGHHLQQKGRYETAVDRRN